MMRNFISIFTMICIIAQFPASLSTGTTRDLAEDIDYASLSVKSFSDECEFFSSYEEYYYLALTNEVNNQAALIDEILVEMQVNEESLKNLREDYSKMLVDVRVIIDSQQQNLADYILFLVQVDYDLYNNLTRLRDEDMDKYEEHFMKVQTDFNEADETIHNINGQLYRDTLSIIDGMSGPEYDAVYDALQSIGETLNSEYSSVMHARLQFSSSKSYTEYALQRVIDQLPPSA